MGWGLGLKNTALFLDTQKICFLISIDPLTIFDVIIILDDENFPQNFTPASLLFSRATLATSENKDDDSDYLLKDMIQLSIFKKQQNI